MEYRMWKCTAGAMENCVPLIKASVKENDNISMGSSLRFVGFEGTAGTKFYLNDSNEEMEIPAVGHFVTPFTGERGMNIWSLKFKEAFSGNIYYII